MGAIVQCGGIVLCGGLSSRMGVSKPLLPFGPERMLQRVVRLLGEVVRPIVVVSRAAQELPALPPDVLHAFDHREGRGPLEGLLAGLLALPEGVDAAYVTGCDVPLLVPAFVSRMIELVGSADIAVPQTDGIHHPLSAVYRRSVVPYIERLLAAEHLRPTFLFDAVPTRLVMAAELTDVDPTLATLENLNQPADYFRALDQAGFVPPAEILELLRPQ
jgi:molybdopterin-guanine dinucleotide biosynthesis protein A